MVDAGKFKSKEVDLSQPFETHTHRATVMTFKMCYFFFAGTERFSAHFDLRRRSFLRYPQHRELPGLSSGL